MSRTWERGCRRWGRAGGHQPSETAGGGDDRQWRLFSASVIALALSQSLVFGIVLQFIGGVMSTVFGTIVATFTQVATPNELRGRVMSLYAITLIGLPALGVLGSGGNAELLGGIDGAPHAVLIGGVVVGAILILVAPFFWRRSVSAPRA